MNSTGAGNKEGAGEQPDAFSTDGIKVPFSSADSTRGPIPGDVVFGNNDTPAPDEWPPLDGPELLPPGEPPYDALPAVLGDHARQIAEVVQVDGSLPFFGVLTVAGFSTGARTYISPKVGVRVRANIYVIGFLPSGERKSTMYGPVVEPLELFASDHADEWRDTCRRRAIANDKRERLMKRLGDPSLTADESAELEAQLLAIEDPAGTCPYYLAEDVTPEALEVQLQNTDERVAVFSDDGRDTVANIEGRHSRDGKNREHIFLKGLDGQSKKTRRIGRGEVVLHHPAISLFLLVQDDHIATLGANVGLRTGGFLPRCISFAPPSLVGTRFWSEQGIDPEIQRRYNSAVRRRLERYRDQPGDRIVPMQAAAKAAWVDWYQFIEAQSGEPAGEYMNCASFAGRWAALPLRFAAILAEYHGREGITADDMQNAIVIARYAIAHTRRVLAMMKRELPDDLARAVRHIRDKQMIDFIPNTLRAAMRATAGQVADILDELELRGYVRQTAERRGHKNAIVYEARPDLWAGE